MYLLHARGREEQEEVRSERAHTVDTLGARARSQLVDVVREEHVVRRGVEPSQVGSLAAIDIDQQLDALALLPSRQHLNVDGCAIVL